jgi:hypothetical protein
MTSTVLFAAVFCWSKENFMVWGDNVENADTIPIRHWLGGGDILTSMPIRNAKCRSKLSVCIQEMELLE